MLMCPANVWEQIQSQYQHFWSLSNTQLGASYIFFDNNCSCVWWVHHTGRTFLFLPMFFLPPATKLGQGYVFTGVCHSVNRGWGCLPQCMLGYTPRSRHAPCSRPPLGADTPPGADTTPQADTPWSRHTAPTPTPPSEHAGEILSMRGWYASYRNAILFTGRNKVVAKVIFLHLSVILFTGGGFCLSACWDAHPPPGADTPSREQTPPHPGADTPLWEADSGIRSTSGRYASYWNAFLFLFCFAAAHKVKGISMSIFSK